MTARERVTITEGDYLRILVHGATAFELLRTGLELDLFEHLERTGGMDVARTAHVLGVAEQPARILLLGLCSLRLLDKVDGRYVNTGLARRRLLRSRDEFAGPLVDVQARIVNTAITDLAESIRRDTNVGLRHLPGEGTTLYQRLVAHPDLQRVFYTNMGDASRRTFGQVLDHYDFSGVGHVLDIGGGDGTNALELARRHPHLTVTVVDQDSVVTLARERLAGIDAGERVRFHAADLLTGDLPAGADAILLCHLFEIWSLERDVRLLRRCHAALPDHGVCLIYNFVCDDESTGPLRAGLLSPYFLTLASGEGMIYSARDMAQALRDAGFARVERFDDLGFSHALVVGHKA